MVSHPNTFPSSFVSIESITNFPYFWSTKSDLSFSHSPSQSVVVMMDYYKALGLNRSATKEEIKEAFRKLALKFHPDKHSQSPKPIRDGATLRFKQVSEAYEVLIDDRKRADYNLRYRSGGGAGVGVTSSSSSGSGYSYYGYYEYGYNRRPKYRSTSTSDIRQGNKWGFDLDVAFRFITSKRFLLNLALASVLLGGAVVIERSGETLWKMHNSGKSFEEAMESIEKTKTQKEKR